MEDLAAWKFYWSEVIAESFHWAILIWPIPTIFLALFIAVLTVVIHRNIGQHQEARNAGISIGIGIAASVIAFVVFVIFIGPFLHSEGIKAQLKELGDLRGEKKNFATTIEELTNQRDQAISEKKMFEEARDIVQAELDKLRLELNQARRQLDDRKASIADKAARKAQADKLASFLDIGEAIKQKCFSGSDVPRKEAVEWHDQILSYLKTTMDSSHVIRFKNTPAPNARLSYFLPDRKPVARMCNENAQDIDMKLKVLRDFLSELSK